MTPAQATQLRLLEKKAGSDASRAIRTGIIWAIRRTTHAEPGGEALSKSGSRAVYKDDRLQRVTIRAPHYIFKQHYGFEGRKSNGVNMRLKATGVIDLALDKSNVLETLATQIANIRIDQAVLNINFERRANQKHQPR